LSDSIPQTSLAEPFLIAVSQERNGKPVRQVFDQRKRQLHVNAMGAYAFAEITAIAGQDHLRRYPLPGALPGARLLLHHAVHVRHSIGTRAIVNLHEFGYVLFESGYAGIPSVSGGGRPAEPESFIVQAGIVPCRAE